MISVKRYGSIHDVNPCHWDSILTKTDSFHTHRFVSIIEDAKVEDAQFHYLLFYEEDKLMATTVLSIFYIHLDLFLGDVWIVKQLRQWFPNLFRIRILVCGLPASFGQHNLVIAHDRYAPEVCALLAREMNAIAREQRIRFMTVKEFKESEQAHVDSLGQYGFFKANSIPYMHMKLQWESFNAYLHSLRHHYRRQILKSLKKAGPSFPVIQPLFVYNGTDPSPAWVLCKPGEDSADAFYPGYLRVMERTATKLETLNLPFFRLLFSRQDDCRILHFVVQHKVLSSAILVPAGDTLCFMLVAHTNDRDDYDSYFNLVYGIIAFAIGEGYRFISLGQTAYWLKQCVGAEPEHEYLWFASRSRAWHWVLRSLRSSVFPETKLKALRVFKKMEQPAHAAWVETMGEEIV